MAKRDNNGVAHKGGAAVSIANRMNSSNSTPAQRTEYRDTASRQGIDLYSNGKGGLQPYRRSSH